MNRSLTGLCFGDEPGNLRKRCVISYSGSAHNNPPTGVHCGSCYRIADTHLDGQALTREQGCINCRRAGLDDPVGRDLLARADHEPLPNCELINRDGAFNTAVVDDGNVFRTQLEQGP